MARSLGGNTVTDRHGRELIAHGSVQFPVACYENDMSEKTVPWHWHDDWEVIAVEKGAAMFAAGSDRYVIREGQGLFINGGVLHGIWGHGKFRLPVHFNRLSSPPCGRERRQYFLAEICAADPFGRGTPGNLSEWR